MKTAGPRSLPRLAGVALLGLAEPVGSSPELVTQWTQDGLKRMRDIAQRAGIQAE